MNTLLQNSGELNRNNTKSQLFSPDSISDFKLNQLEIQNLKSLIVPMQ